MMFNKGDTYYFHMSGGQIIEVNNVAELTMTRDNTTGEYQSCSIKWAEGSKPKFFSLSIPNIIAVTSEK